MLRLCELNYVIDFNLQTFSIYLKTVMKLKYAADFADVINRIACTNTPSLLRKCEQKE